MKTRRFIVGITGASAVIYAIRLLQELKQASQVETHLVMSKAAGITLRLECPEWELEAVRALADISYKEMDIAAAIASGSFPIDAMLVVPASMKTVAQIATGTGQTLLHRAADVTLKERRPLYVVPRETPLHLGHLRNLTTLAELGAVVVPPMPAFYHRPNTLDEVIDHTVGKLLDLLGIEHRLFRRWQGPES
ncbi:MAG: UbiX family flavin prenyltransferase [Vulcanimicrobiota bacterium]